MSKKTAKEKNRKTAITRFVDGHVKAIVIVALTVAILAVGCAVGLIMHGRNVAIDGVKYEYSGSLGGYVASAANTDITGALVLSEVDGKPVLALADDAFKRADLNGDGVLNTVEALRILQYLNGKVSTLKMG